MRHLVAENRLVLARMIRALPSMVDAAGLVHFAGRLSPAPRATSPTSPSTDNAYRRPAAAVMSTDGPGCSCRVTDEQMFEELSERQLQQLEKVWTTAAKSVHWRENLRYEMSKALATDCTLEHLAAVTGFDHQTIERLRHEPPNDFNGRHPTGPHGARPRAVLPVTPIGRDDRVSLVMRNCPEAARMVPGDGQH